MRLLRKIHILFPRFRNWLVLLAILIPADTPLGALHSFPPCVAKWIPPAAWGAAYFPQEEQFAWAAARDLIAHSDFMAAQCFFGFPHSSLLTNPQYWLDQGDAAWGVGDAQTAVRDWEQAGPGASGAESRLRAGYERLGEWEKAAGLCDSWISIHPEDTAAGYRCALISVVISPAKALPALGRISAAPYSAQAASLADAIREALPSGDSAYLDARAGEELIRQNEPWLAEALFQKAVQLRPDYGDAHALLGLALENQRMDGGSEYQAGAQLAPNSSTACLFYGSWLRRNHQPDLARIWLERAWRLQPGDSAIATELAALNFDAGNLAAAESALQEAVNAHPQSAAAWLALAEYYIRNEIRVEQSGIPAARQAVLLDPLDPDALELLGRAYFLQGDFSIAGALFRKALDLSPLSSSLHANLGLTLEQEGDLAGARRELGAAIQLDPNSPAGRQAQTALDRIIATS
jgi:Flp pilus assembly protein TadD